MTGQDFRQAYESGKVQTLDGYHYLGETNGAVYMLRTRVPLFGSKPKQKVLFTETNALDPSFLRQMREESKVESGRREDCPKRANREPGARDS
jgi:hypothetical protein